MDQCWTSFLQNKSNKLYKCLCNILFVLTPFLLFAERSVSVHDMWPMLQGYGRPMSTRFATWQHGANRRSMGHVLEGWSDISTTSTRTSHSWTSWEDTSSRYLWLFVWIVVHIGNMLSDQICMVKHARAVPLDIWELWSQTLIHKLFFLFCLDNHL
mgnify:CR=1 FL=1